MNRLIMIVVAAMACLLLSSVTFAAGGIFVDDFLVTNDGTSIFADNFAERALSPAEFHALGDSGAFHQVQS